MQSTFYPARPGSRKVLDSSSAGSASSASLSHPSGPSSSSRSPPARESPRLSPGPAWFRPANKQEGRVSELKRSPPELTCPWVQPSPPRTLLIVFQLGHRVSAFPLSGSKPFDPEECSASPPRREGAGQKGCEHQGNFRLQAQAGICAGAKCA